MYFFCIPASNTEAAAVITNGAKTFYAKGTAIFINGSANLFKRILSILQIEFLLICALERFMSADVLY